MRPLVIDLSPLGLVPVGAYFNETVQTGVGFRAGQLVQCEDTGEWMPELRPLKPSERQVTITFFEALAVAEERTKEMRRRNDAIRAEWGRYNPWAGDDAAPGEMQNLSAADIYAPLSLQGGGVLASSAHRPRPCANV